MPGKDAGDAGRRGRQRYSLHKPRSARDTGRSADLLAPLEERTPAGVRSSGDGPNDTIRMEGKEPEPSGGLLDGDESEHGVFYMPPVVAVTVSLFLAYTLFVAVLIAVG